ncbi:MAG: DEAD/DEAH box helicase, partial [Thermoprotei archaeon]
MSIATFMGGCPNCHGKISGERLQLGLPCESCLRDIPGKLANGKRDEKFRRTVYTLLNKAGSLAEYSRLVELDVAVDEFEKLFVELTGSKPWSAQLTWAKRSIRGESFAIIAPTGVGKTTFAYVFALYQAMKGRRVLVVSQTALLARQTAQWIKKGCEKIGASIPIAEVHGEETQKAKKTALAMAVSGEAKIVVVTSMGLGRVFDTISNHRFDYALVDDVDSLLRKSLNIDRVLTLLGFDEPVRALAFEAIKRRMKLARLFSQGLGDSDEVKATLEEYRRITSEIEAYKKSHTDLGKLVVSSATARPRGMKVRLFRELLGFEAGSSTGYLRNITDIAVSVRGDMLQEVVSRVKSLGKGGLV